MEMSKYPKQSNPHTSSPTEVEQEEDKTMDVTFVLEESGVTATVEVPCEADVAAAKEIACTALSVSPASVEMRIGTQVLEGTCRLQDTAFDAGVQVVLARRFADIKCPAEYNVEVPTGGQGLDLIRFSLPPCGALCLFTHKEGYFTVLDTETFSPAFKFTVDVSVCGPPAISRCKTRCYLPCRDGVHEVALPGGNVLRKLDGPSYLVFACGGVVVSQGKDGVSVYDEDLTLLRTLSHEGCNLWGGSMAVSDCGGWVITSSLSEMNAHLWDVNTGEDVACVPMSRCIVALSRSASVFAVVDNVDGARSVQLYDWSGTALQNATMSGRAVGLQFTPCGKYLVVRVQEYGAVYGELHQYDVATMSCVLVIPDATGASFTISPCSRVVVFVSSNNATIATRHLHPHNE